MKRIITITLALALTIAFTPTAYARTDWVSIPQAKISERLQWAGYNLDTQVICDKRDRAVAYPYRGSVSIADHNYQGFANLHKVRKGMTATVTLQGRTTRYKCVKTFNGYNKSVYLIDSNYRIVEITPSQRIMYTCIGRGSSNRIYITIWQKVR